MSDQDVFGEQQPNPEATPPASNTNPFDDQLKEIKNEAGEPKYKDVDTALNALKESQQFIEQLKQEKAAAAAEAEKARLELERMGGIESFVERLKPSTPNPESKETPKVESGLSEEKVAALLEEQLKQREQASQQQKNLDKVVQQLEKDYGDDVSTYLEKRAKELGTTKAGLKELASGNPTMALNLFKKETKTDPKPASSQSAVNVGYQETEDNPRPKFERGAARGGYTDRELAGLWRESAAYTNKRLNVE